MKCHRLISLLLAVILVLALALPVCAAAPSVTVSAQAVYFEEQPCSISAYNIDGYNYFKLRDVAQLLSGSPAQFGIAADQATMTIAVTPGDPYESNGTELQPLSETFGQIVASGWKLSVNGQIASVGAYNIDGSNYFKLADLGNAIGFGVRYDKALNAVMVTSEKSFQALLGESADVGAHWFDDAVFVGDSVSIYLSIYGYGEDALGDATFLVAGSYSATNALAPVSDSSIHPSFQGTKMKTEDAIVLSGANKVYIMLGMNDIGYGVDYAVEKYTAFVNNILKQAPDVQIFVQSVTPMVKGSTSTSNSLNNTTITRFNEAMQTVCQENGWYYLDVAGILKDADGYLKTEYCSDNPTMGIHIYPSVIPLWVNYLRTHAPQD